MINFTIKNDLKQKSYFFYFFCNFLGGFHLNLFWKVFQMRPSLPVVDSTRVVTLVAEFAVVVAADDDIVQVTIFGPSLPYFEFSFAIFLPHGLLQLLILSTLMFHFPLFYTSLFYFFYFLLFLFFRLN